MQKIRSHVWDVGIQGCRINGGRINEGRLYRFSHTLSTNLMLDSRNRAWAYCLQYQALLLEYITLVMLVIQYFGEAVLKSSQCKHKFKYHKLDADIIINKENVSASEPSLAPAVATSFAEPKVDQPIDATPSQINVCHEQSDELTVPLLHPPPSKTGSD